MNRWTQPTLALVLCTLVLPAAAQTLYRYVDERGKVYYSDKPLTHLTGRPVDQMSKQGTVVKRTPASPTPEERAAMELAERRRAEAEKANAHEQRRNLALLATYSSEKEVEDAHVFALRDPLALVRETEAKLAAAQKRHAAVKAEVEKQAGKSTPESREKLATAELEVKSLTDVLDSKRRDVQLINDRFEEDKRRYAELAKQRQAIVSNANSPTMTPTPAAAPNGTRR
jgi:hypothetical protein